MDKYARKSQTIAEHRGEGDKSSKMSQSSMTNRTHSTKNTIKQPTGSSQFKSVKQNAASLTSKSGPIKASSSHSIKKSTSTRSTRSENVPMKSSDDSTVKKRKSREQTGYSEKRGLSTIYMPKAAASKINIKSSEKTEPRVTRGDGEKSRGAAVVDQTKSRMPSKERRKSRTLSPSEIRMLHSAVKRSGAAEKIDSRNTQPDSNEGDYDYEDDFEVNYINLEVSPN